MDAVAQGNDNIQGRVHLGLRYLTGTRNSSSCRAQGTSTMKRIKTASQASTNTLPAETPAKGAHAGTKIIARTLWGQKSHSAHSEVPGI